MFNHIRNHETFPKWLYRSAPLQQRVRMPGALHSHQPVALSAFSMLVILIREQWYLAVILVGISHDYDVKHLFFRVWPVLCLLLEHICSNLLTWILLLSYNSCFLFSGSKSFVRCMNCGHFLPIWDLPFRPLCGDCWQTELLSFDEVSLMIFNFVL